MPQKILSQKAYEAYGDAVGWVNYQGKPMPQWEGLTEIIQDAWGAAVSTVAVEIARVVGKAMSGNPSQET